MTKRKDKLGELLKKFVIAYDCNWEENKEQSNELRNQARQAFIDLFIEKLAKEEHFSDAYRYNQAIRQSKQNFEEMR